MSTKAQLRTAIKREARINSSTNLDSMVDDIVADLMRDFCNKTRYHELLVMDFDISTTLVTTATWNNTGVGSVGLVTLTVPGQYWNSTRDGQTVRFAGIVTGGYDSLGTYLLKVISSTAANVTINGVTPVAINPPTTSSGLVTITGTAGTAGLYTLPTDFQNLSELRYATASTGQDLNSLYYRTLIAKTDVVKRFSVVGYPMFYRLIAASKVNIFPSSLITSTDFLKLDYYIDPATLYTTDASEFPIPRLEGAVKKAAIARVQRFSGAIAETQLTDKDADASFTASEGGH